MEELKNSCIENAKKLSNYSKTDMLEFYFNKLARKILFYCKLEELNAPLVDFIEDKLIKIGEILLAKESLNKSNESGAAINGIDLKNIKSITRGDTAITLKDSSSANKIETSIDDVMEFDIEDYSVLNRYRKVYW